MKSWQLLVLQSWAAKSAVKIDIQKKPQVYSTSAAVKTTVGSAKTTIATAMTPLAPRIASWQVRQQDRDDRKSRDEYSSSSRRGIGNIMTPATSESPATSETTEKAETSPRLQGRLHGWHSSNVRNASNSSSNSSNSLRLPLYEQFHQPRQPEKHHACNSNLTSKIRD